MIVEAQRKWGQGKGNLGTPDFDCLMGQQEIVWITHGTDPVCAH